jgi:hypothetical protein
MRTTDKYIFFWDGVFSQWHRSLFKVDNIHYTCAEQYMMAEKARLFKDDDTLKKILLATKPFEQKKLGREVKNFNKTAWDKVAKDIVYKGNYAKFTQNADLKKVLLETGNRLLVEASPADRIWGIGLHWGDEKCLDPTKWRGTNWLGETLTKVRNDIIGEHNDQT